MGLNLTGRYEDGTGRAYVVMQDDVQRTDRNASISFLRVMRQRDEEVVSGNVHISDEAFERAGADDTERSAALARAVVGWLAGRPSSEQHFQLRAGVAPGAATGVEMLSELFGVIQR